MTNKKLLNKTMTIDAEMMGKASYFINNGDSRVHLRGIGIAKSSALNDGINIIATDTSRLVIFNDSRCKNSNLLTYTKARIYIDCVIDNGQLTRFIKDCRTQAVLKERPTFTLTFLDEGQCLIKFNGMKYTFRYGNDFVPIAHILSSIKIKSQDKPAAYNPRFLHSFKHLDLSWHKSSDSKGSIIFLTTTSGQLLALTQGAILIMLPLFTGETKKSSLGRFVRGMAADDNEDSLFEAAYRKKAYKKEFGSLLADELLLSKIQF
jgi:hypothetical protein